MRVIVRLSSKGLKANKALPEDARVRDHEINRQNEYYRTLPAQPTPEQAAVCQRLALADDKSPNFAFSGTIHLGNFMPSTITREPLVVPIAYDAPPTDDEIWQQLSVMASQHDDLVNPSGMAF